MKKNKNISLMGLLICASMFFTTCVFADDTNTITLNSDNLNPMINDTFKIIANVEKNNENKCIVKFDYDTDKLYLNGITNISNFSKNEFSTDSTKTPEMSFKAIKPGKSIIKITSVEGCGTSTALNQVEINVKDANLLTLTLSTGELSPTFNPSTTEYAATITEDKVTIGATAPDDIKISGIGEQTIKEGENKSVKITTTAKNGSKKIYTINLSRPAKEKSDNRNLKSITFNNEVINIEQDKSTYEINVKNSVEKPDLKYEVEDEKAKVDVKGPKELQIGENTFTITVTAEDGSTKEYKLIVTRQDIKNIIDNDLEAILEEIENGEEAYIYISVNQAEKNKIADKKIIEKLKEHKKTVIYEITNEDGDILYSVTIKGRTIKEVNEINYGLTFKSNNKTKINQLITSSKIMYLNFDGEDKLSTDLTVKIFVGDKFKNKDVLYLYYYNEKDNKLEKVKTKFTVKNGYIETNVEKFGEYILSTEDIEKPVTPTTNNNMIIYICVGAGVFLLVIIVIIVIIIKKKKNKDNPKKDKKKNKDKQTEELETDKSEELEKTIIMDGKELNPSVIAQTPSVVEPNEEKQEESTENNKNDEPETTKEEVQETKIEEKEEQPENIEKNKEEDKKILPPDDDDIEIIDDLQG